MGTIKHSSHRLMMVAGVVTLALAFILTPVLSTSHPSLARGAARTELAASQSAPSPSSGHLPQHSPPPPLDPPVQRPTLNWAPRQSVDQATLHSILEAEEFQPQMRIQLADTPQLQAAPKPAGAERTDAPKPAPERTRPSGGFQSPSQADELQTAGWNWIAGEGFEGDSPDPLNHWAVYDYGGDGYDRTWGNTDYLPYWENQSAWPAAGGLNGLDPNYYYYTDNLNSWMIWGPFDFNNAADAFVDFYLRLDTELYYDWFYFGVSVDGSNYDLYYWSGDSEGWIYQPFWLSAYAGYSQVWLAFGFTSDETISAGYDGPFVDEINLWTYELPALDPSGDLVIDGSFENGGEGWWYASFAPTTSQTAEAALAERVAGAGAAPLQPMEVTAPTDVYLTDLTAVDGDWSALMYDDADWNDYLFQPITIPVGATDIQFDFWFAVTTYEWQQYTDWFCASLTDASYSMIVDLGCLDATFTTGYWQEVLYSLTDAEVADAVAAGTVNLVFELYNRGPTDSGTAAWIDYVRFYATGGDGGSYIDLNEPNDDPTSTTYPLPSFTCDGTVSGVVGDALVGYGDVDWFKLDAVPVGQLDLDINAQTKMPASALDSVVYLYDSGLNYLDSNDDDGATYDSYLTFDNLTPNATFYVAVVSYSGYGGPDSFYDLTAKCAGSGGGPPPPPDTPPGDADTWTLMLYLNAEDRSFEQTLLGYIDDMEAVVNGKSSFLNVTVLYDGPNNGDTVRYLIQSTGVYTDGVNRWKLSEQNMGDPDTLAGFAGWSMDNYPAENYYLAVDDHGHGVYGISWDATNGNDSLTPPEVYSALKDATNNGARKISIFDYEACLMGMAENAYDVREWVDYVVFFEQISWGLDTYPQYFSDLAGANTPATVGTRIVNRYHTQADSAGYPHTISLVDTSQMADVKQAVTDLGDALSVNGTGDATRLTAVTNARGGAQAFAAADDATNPALADYIDLWDLADKTDHLSGVATAAGQVKGAVDAAVVHEQHSSGVIGGFFWDHADAHGLSIYYPTSNASSAFSDYTAERLFQMSTYENGIDGRWDTFLLWAVGEGGNGASGGIGGGDRKGMTMGRFLQPKLGGSKFVYLPLVVK